MKITPSKQTTCRLLYASSRRKELSRMSYFQPPWQLLDNASRAMALCPQLLPKSAFLPTHEIQRKVQQPGEFEAGIDIVLDDIKRKIVKTADAQNPQGHQSRGFETWILQEQEHGRQRAG